VAVKAWIQEEAKQMNLSDKRLVKRYKKLLEIMTEKPSSSIPKACNSFAETKAAYRFFDNENVEPQTIRDGFYASTASRIKGQKIVLLPTDTTDLNFSSHRALKGKGVLTNWQASGLILHSAFAVDLKGTPLGLLFQKCWARKKEDYGKKIERKKMPIEKRESFKWLESLRGVQDYLPDETIGIVISDRESDFYDYFSESRNSNCELLLRAKQSRELAEGLRLFDKLESLEPAGIFKTTIKKNRGLEEREAELEVRFTSVTLMPPKKRSRKGLFPIPINVISVKEINFSGKESVEWVLLTTLSINNFEDAVQYIKWYSMRWLIERYHYTLKSGCQVEKLQLEDSDRIDCAAAVYCVVAWRLMYVTYLGRNEPDEPALIMLEKHELEALYSFVNKTKKPPKQPLSNKEAVLLIARLGGFNNRKSDGVPGLKVIWRGLSRLKDIANSYLLWGKRCG
jgi:Transposase DNA-binding/Transposase Tn5 dimerisation domain